MRPAFGMGVGRHKAGPYRIGVGMPEAVRGRREGRHKAGPYGDWVGLVGVVWLDTFDWALVTNVDTRSTRHVVGRGRCGGGAPAQGRAE
ncbi:MAG: hypothetical protein OXF54_20630 [Caldilineaceae bacterium]|nr:hypothetical protein [Caldilineaceae bacterium]